MLAAVLSTSSGWAAKRVSTFGYDTAGLLTRETVEPVEAGGNQDSALTLETIYGLDAAGNRTQATTGVAGDQRVRKTTYDTQKRFQTSRAVAIDSTPANDHVELVEYDPKLGVLKKLTGPNGFETTWTYDNFGRKTQEKRADGTKTKWEYKLCNSVAGGDTACFPATARTMVQVTPLDNTNPGVQNGPITRTYLDALGREVRTETEGFDPLGTPDILKVDTQYNARGQVLQKSRPYISSTPQWTVFTYDDLSRVLTATAPDSTVISYTYKGTEVTVTNAATQIRKTVRNSQGQVVSVTEGKTTGLLATTKHFYNAFGNLTETRDAANSGGTVTYSMTATYDIRGRKLTMNDPDTGNWSYQYNRFGEMTQQTDAKSQVTTFAYDRLGRMTSRIEPDLKSFWTYDTAASGKGKGKLHQAEARDSANVPLYRRTHNYDTAAGRPTSTQLEINQDVVRGTTLSSYTYTTAYEAGTGRVATVQYPSGHTIRYEYTSRGFLKQVRDHNGVGGQFYWRADLRNAEGQLTQFTHGNNVSTTLTYETNTPRLQGIAAGSANSVQNLAYEYDQLGNLKKRTDSNQSVVEDLTYDEFNRLKSSTIGANAKSYDYDLIGNLISKTGVGTYDYNKPGGEPGPRRPHAVRGTSGGPLTTTFTYDGNGNMLTGNGRTYTWTSFDMVAAVSRGSGTQLTFLYDTEHRRIRQDAPDGATLHLNDPISGAGIERFKGSGGTNQWNNYIRVAGEIVAVFYDKDGGTAQDVVRHFHKDHLGSIVAITDHAGLVVQRLAYDPWGKRRNLNGTDDTLNVLEGQAQTDRGYTGHEHLQEVALIHMNGRVYDAQIARFSSADPFIQDLMSTQALNRYTYVNNNPLTLVDPSGYFSIRKVKKFFAKNPVLGLAVGLAAAWVLGPEALALIGPLKSIDAALVVGAVSGGLSGGLKGAALGAVSGALTFGIGKLPLEFLGDLAFLGRAALHGVAQGSFAEMQGGRFGSAFFSAAFSNAASSGFGAIDALKDNVVAQTVTAAVIGGTASALGGGKFQNGAATAAFVYVVGRIANGGLGTLGDASSPGTGTPDPASGPLPRVVGVPDDLKQALADVFGRSVSEIDKVTVTLDPSFVADHGPTIAATTRVDNIYIRSVTEFFGSSYLIAHEYYHVLIQWGDQGMTKLGYFFNWRTKEAEATNFGRANEQRLKPLRDDYHKSFEGRP